MYTPVRHYKSKAQLSCLKEGENATYLLGGKMKVETSPWKVLCNAAFRRLDFYLKLEIKYSFSQFYNSKFLSKGD